MALFINRAEASADYLGNTYADVAEVAVEMNVLTCEKTADKMIWYDNGPLTYTVRITNNIPEPSGSEVMNLEFKDVIDTTIAHLDTTSVKVDNVAQILNSDFVYYPSTGLFTFLNLDRIPGLETMVIEYKVVKNG